VIERSSSTQENPSSGGAVLSIRLWTRDAGDPSGEPVWKDTTLAASVAADLIEASGGTGIVTDGDLLVSKFSSVPKAILAARRIQWAVSGFAEAGSTGSAAILIESAQDHFSQTSSNPSRLPLEHAAPGQILLAEATCRSLENLPGLSLLPLSDALRELRWRTSESTPDRDQDDQVLDRLMRQHGLEDPETAQPEETSVVAPAFDSVPPVEAERALPVRVPVDEPNGAYEIWLARLREMPFWLKGVSGAIPLAIVCIVLFVLFHSKPTAHVSDQPSATVPASPAQSKPPAPGDASTANPQAAAKTTAASPSKAANAGHNPHQAQSNAKPASSCVLNASDISSELSIADARFQNRQYKEAERRYRSVLACQPENSHAANGAERARQALQLQPSSNP
jgi:hypothetical protein